jgi:hypothetical protein
VCRPKLTDDDRAKADIVDPGALGFAAGAFGSGDLVIRFRVRHETAHRALLPASRMHRARRDLELQTLFATTQTTGTFALRSPVRPNPIASSIVELLAIGGTTLQVRGLDCLNGTPLIDLKPERGAVSD